MVASWSKKGRRKNAINSVEYSNKKDMHTVLDLPRLKKVPTIHPDFTVKNRILMEDGSIGQVCKSITSPRRKYTSEPMIWTI